MLPIWPKLKHPARLARNAFFGTADSKKYWRQRTKSDPSGIDAVISRWPHLRVSHESPIFILSAGWRSGSTLLQRLIISENNIIWGEPYNLSSPVQNMTQQLRAFSEYWPAQDAFVGDQIVNDEDLRAAWVANLYPEPQAFVDAHLAYWSALFERPRCSNMPSYWGLKEVVLNMEHVRYLHWLYPHGRFIFLCRNPIDAWQSYRRWRRWFARWPDQQIRTPTQFGRLWANLAAAFLDEHASVNGIFVRYEDLDSSSVATRLSKYLRFPVQRSSQVARITGDFSGIKSPPVPKIEKLLLKRQVKHMCGRLGYQI